MRRVMLGLVFGIFLIGLVVAQSEDVGSGIHDVGTGLDNAELKEAGQGTGQGLEDGDGVMNQNQIVEQVRSKNQLKFQEREVNCNGCELVEEDEDGDGVGEVMMKLSNGRNARIKVMPDVASETALKRLRLRVCREEDGCEIQLKQVGSGNETRAAYEIQAERHFRILGLFRTKAQVRAQVDAENGEIVGVKKPWWAFLASEPVEGEEEDSDDE